MRRKPIPTRGLRVEVVIDDWRSMVIAAPIAMTMYPFTSVAF
jgi:hypothetical protein